MNPTERTEAWRRANPERYLKYQRELMREKREQDPTYRKRSDQRGNCEKCGKYRTLVRITNPICRTCYRKEKEFSEKA